MSSILNTFVDNRITGKQIRTHFLHLKSVEFLKCVLNYLVRYFVENKFLIVKFSISCEVCWQVGVKKQVDRPTFVPKVASLHGVLLAGQQGPGDVDQLACLHGQQPFRKVYRKTAYIRVWSTRTIL